MSATAPDATLPAAEHLRAYAAQADARLALVLAQRERELGRLPFGIAGYYGDLRDYVLAGGKRLRGALVMLGYAACGGTQPAPVLDASLSFELLHAYLLAYDDVMDRDEVRRGGPALHVRAAEQARRTGSREPAHRGLSVALLLGMLARSLAWELLRATALPAERVARALAWLAHVEEGVTVGQLLDVCASDAPRAAAEDLAEIRRRKTGLYTTEGPLVLGAILADAAEDDPRRAALRAYAEPLGEAFQLVDDVLSATGDPASTGKPAMGDIREGRRTAVVEEALARASPDDRETLEGLLGRPLDEPAAREARRILETSGAVDAVRRRARALADDAARALDGAGLDPTAREVLSSLARLVIERRT